MNFRVLSFAVAMSAALYGVYQYLEARLDDFYIFNPDQLHAIAWSGIDRHGNDTAAIVNYIVKELNNTDSVQPYLNLEQEWMFNNAGGAMGQMYIIHASTSLLYFQQHPHRH